MRRLLSVCLLLAATCPAHAQQKPNTLTPKEIADGWILLFDGETTFGWDVFTSERDGRLRFDEGIIDMGELGVSHIGTTSKFMDLEVTFEHKSLAASRVAGFRILKGVDQRVTKVFLEEKDNWTPTTMRVSGGEVRFNQNVNGGADWNDRSQVFFAGTMLQLRNIKLRPLNTKPLFNGADLAGWKTFPGDKYKSKFAVVDGAINVKDGPGDLQTVGKYKDFILQLECKSNGKHLNSGIFFRCRENEYQNGYECQIRNQFTERPTQKYTIEDFDSMTNKLLGKRDIMSTAVDYGTGAIYRRVPARKEMAKDGEWFGMTIVAHGNHFATWVNGVQVVDWTDNRPKDDNARKGCCLNAGHISIQGHDPTTDLSFRNIRIAEFK